MGMAVDDEDEELHEKLFTQPGHYKNKVKYSFEAKGSSLINFDVESLKNQVRNVNGGRMSSSGRKHSISSEESLSDYEELGFTQRRRSLMTCSSIRPKESNPAPSYCTRIESNAYKILWDEKEIDSRLQRNVFNDSNKDVQGIIQDENLEALTKLLSEKSENFRNHLLLWASWKGKINLVRFLLEQKANPNTTDLDGRTCLHLAACSGDLDTLRTLLSSPDINVNSFDKQHQATPLFCAALSSNTEVIRSLIESGCDINAGLHEHGSTALHCAVKANAVENVRLLLESGAVPNNVLLFSETPLHTAASMGYAEVVKLLIENGACLEVLMGTMKMTALHLAAQEGNSECVRYLVEGGANIDIRNGRGQSALHLAALSQSPETVEIILKAGANPNGGDYDRRTPLHSAIVKGSRSYDCVRLLLDAGADVNHKDRFGYAPLHIAALNEYSYCANMLLAFGADITARTKGGTSALSMIVRKTPNVLPKFEDMLDHAITLAEHDINDVDCELKLDFRVLIPNRTRGESNMFINFIETGHNHLLKHPLCESFLHLKWLKVRKFFLVSLIFHLLFTILHTTFVLQVYYSGQCIIKDNCKYGNVTDFQSIERIPYWESVSGDCFEPLQEECKITAATLFVWISLLFSTTILMGKECFQLAHSQKMYFYNWENWVQLGIILDVILISFHRDPFESLEKYVPLIGIWQHHAAAIGVFLVWGELMLMIGRLPTFGIYVQMFTTVAKNFAKFLAAYFCLLVAFALSFCVLFPNYQSFNVKGSGIFSSVIKTLVMMAGEIEYENFIYENGKNLFVFTGHLMVLIFVLLVSIILMNLLVGLAVSDIQGLQKSAGLDRLVRQTELISHIESMLFSRLLHCLPIRFLGVLHQKALVVPHGYSYIYNIRPNDLREDRLPRDITEAIHWLVSTRHRSRKRRPFSRYAARRRVNSVYREKSIHYHGDASKVIEEKLDAVTDIKAQIRVLLSNNEEVKVQQEELSANMNSLSRQVSALSDSLSQVIVNLGQGQCHNNNNAVLSPINGGSLKENKRKGSIEGVMKHLTDFAVTLSATEETPSTPKVTEEKRPFLNNGGNKELKLKRTNIMKRRESQALLEGIRKHRTNNS